MEERVEGFRAKNYGNIVHLDGWDCGSFVTERGIVAVMTDHKNEYVRFDFGYRGMHYIKTFHKIGEKWSDIKLKKRALKFVREIAAK